MSEQTIVQSFVHVGTRLSQSPEPNLQRRSDVELKQHTSRCLLPSMYQLDDDANDEPQHRESY